MNTKHEHQNVVYQYSKPLRKWTFKAGSFTLLASVKGFEMAEKIAHLVNAGFVRTKGNGIDNLCRANIDKMLNTKAI